MKTKVKPKFLICINCFMIVKSSTNCPWCNSVNFKSSDDVVNLLRRLKGAVGEDSNYMNDCIIDFFEE